MRSRKGAPSRKYQMSTPPPPRTSEAKYVKLDISTATRRKRFEFQYSIEEGGLVVKKIISLVLSTRYIFPSDNKAFFSGKLLAPSFCWRGGGVTGLWSENRSSPGVL